MKHQFTGTVLLTGPDCHGESIDFSQMKFQEEVKLTFNFSHEVRNLLGTAKLKKYKNKVVAIITVDNKNFNFNLLKLLTPAIGGKIFSKHGNLVTDCEINELTLAPGKNTDSRIETLKTFKYKKLKD